MRGAQTVGSTVSCGHERKLPVSLMRERWALPLRVMGYWGDYHHAKVLESMGGLLRIDLRMLRSSLPKLLRDHVES